MALGTEKQTRERLASVGVVDQPTFDLWTAVMTGLTDQQISNDPGGTPWAQLVDRAVDMLPLDLAAHANHRSEESRTPPTSSTSPTSRRSGTARR